MKIKSMDLKDYRMTTYYVLTNAGPLTLGASQTFWTG